MVLLAGIVLLVVTIIGAAWSTSFQRGCQIDPIVVDLGDLPPEEGFWTREFNVDKLEKIIVGANPEDVAFDTQGRVFTGVEGWIKRIGVDGSVENHTYTGGHILGIAVGPGDEIYYAAPDQGLFKVSTDGVVHLLTNEVNGREIFFADGVAVAADGTVYFTDASDKFKYKDWVLDVIEGRPNGRILKYDPVTSTTSILMEDQFFPNGVALAPNEEFLLISETSRARVMRYWLKGEKARTLDTFIEGLPAYPDNVRYCAADGNFYIGLIMRRSKSSDWAYRKPNTMLRCLIAEPLVQSVVNDMHGTLLIVVSPEGKLIKKYEDHSGKMINFVTGGSQLGDYVYLSGLGRDFIGRLKLSTLA